MDTLSIAKRLKSKGFSEMQAEAIAFEMQENAHEDHLVTKAYLDEKLGHLEERVDSELEHLEARVDGKLGQMEERMDGKLEKLELRLNSKLDRLELRMTVCMGVMLATLAGVILTAVKLMFA